MSAAVDVGMRSPMPFSAAPPLKAGPFSRSSIIRTLLGVILVGIGLLFTLPYAFAVTANLYGQFSHLTERAVTAT